MSQAGIIDLSGGGGSGSPIETITGNVGGPVSPVGNNINLVTANTTVKFSGASPNLTLDFKLFNLLLGSLGSNITTGLFNTSLGYQAFDSLKDGQNNTAIGYRTQQFLTSGFVNTSIGNSSLRSNISASGNTAIGSSSLGALTSGLGNNVAVGNQSLLTLATGSYNTALGLNSGQSYTTSESSNIVINNSGVVGESNTIRIGTQGSGVGQQNRAFIAGIYNTTPAGGTIANVIIDSNGQLGTSLASFNKYIATAIDYQALITDEIIGVTSTAAPRTITMPNAGMVAGQVWTIKDESLAAATNNITISGNGANVDGAANFVINSNGGAVDIYWNGIAFFIT